MNNPIFTKIKHGLREQMIISYNYSESDTNDIVARLIHCKTKSPH